MNREKYLQMRNALMTEAQNLLNEGKFEEMKAKKAEIEKLDSDFEAIATEQANLAALENKAVPYNPENSAVNPIGAKVVGTTEQDNSKVDYETVFAKVALKRPLNNAEIEVYNKYNPENAYTHNTTNTEIMIPETVIAGIMKEAVELHPILGDVRKLGIKGIVKFVKHTGIVAGDAKYYTESQVVEDEENTFGEIVLGGHELSKSVTVSWKLQEMAVSDFIPFIQEELGERIGAAKAHAIVRGNGTDQPTGIITALKAQTLTPQIKTYATTPGYSDLTAAMAKIASEFAGGVKFYVNTSTLWNNLANLLDGQNRPIFIPDPTSGGVGRIFGKVVEVEDALLDGEILLGNSAKGYIVNTQEQMRLVTEQHAKARTTDFVAYEVNDGNVLAEKAFALIEKAAG
ncbi:phage major capsid protein, HK97 family [Acetoanaerobium noterae]|uniref:Phage major capsid protein, HK97 family n=1 Tax=Acetoanaerobium noterae TaxID=745369 RepID=A0A1T5AM23_9FIRM|nr:phage major capsid protein [Acetoanaerobium noterae]SKB36028.1 phage major capsid protein, HK97 family [Acetoanaerobium noterae]